jgi:hypothetical protein
MFNARVKPSYRRSDRILIRILDFSHDRSRFVASLFWPFVILFGLLLKFVREPVVWRWIARLAGVVGALYVILCFAYDQSSLVAVIDLYLFMGVLGVGLIWFGYRRLNAPAPDTQSRWKDFAALPVGAVLMVISASVLIPDFIQPRLVLEGRVQNARIHHGRRTTDYLADIAGHTVKATTPVYERLKFLPVVRAEVGRGSNYIYDIEYLAN